MFAGFAKTKNPAVLSPLIPLTFLVGYQADMALGKKMERILSESNQNVHVQWYMFCNVHVCSVVTSTVLHSTLFNTLTNVHCMLMEILQNICGVNFCGFDCCYCTCIRVIRTPTYMYLIESCIYIYIFLLFHWLFHPG